jgi:gliding motility-associated-like protein
MPKRLFRNSHFFLLLLAVLTISNVWGQAFYNTPNWRFSNPKPFGFTVLDLDFYDDSKAIAVGQNGVAYTNDGGAKWNYGPLTFINSAGLLVPPSMNDIHYVTPSIAYAVGTQGCMVKTNDGGQTWSFINNPLYPRGRTINAVWFINKDTGYIGGQHNTPDSLPKLYVTRNGGATWDSLNAPLGGKTVVGYINNPNVAPLVWDVTAKDKEIFRIEFLNATTGYITGGGTGLFPSHPAVSSSTCLPSGTTSTSAQNASLVWKFKDGNLVDYSFSKERLGYTGINTTTITCSSRFANVSPQVQQYRAINIINDTTVVLMSFNNNIVIRLKTGVNDSTLNVNVPGLYEKGKYEVLNFPFPPNGATPIPNPQVLLASNPYFIRRAASGKLYATGNFGRFFTSVDTGRNWVMEASLKSNQNYSGLGAWALDITPSGRFYVMGTQGVMSDSIPGGSFTSNYVTTPLNGAFLEMEFPDCNNGMAVGGSSVNVTEDGGQTWIDKSRPDFVALNISITGLSYPNAGRAYLSTSVGNLYTTTDKGTTLDPVYSNNLLQLNDVSVVGTDSIWMAAFSAFSVPSASRTSSIVRSFDAGATWTVIGGFPVGSTSPVLSKITFPSKNTGYVAGSRNAVYKTTDGGTTWTSISPFPTLNFAPAGFPNTSITYTEVFALDDNTVFLTGNMFTSVAVKRVYKSTDGGTTWTDITANIPAFGAGNLNGILMHDANNGYVVSPGGVLYYTNNGGTSWSLDLAPTGSIFETLAFSPRSVPASISMQNRRLFVAGVNISGAPIMEYGALLNINPNSTENIVNANCTNLSAGSITVNATGGLAPYTYKINTGSFQNSNVFTGLTQGSYVIQIKDAFCGLTQKTVTVGFSDNLTLTTSNDTTVCAGAPVQLLASTNGTGSTYSWSPSAGLSNTNTANPTATVNSNSTFIVTANLNGCVRTKPVTITVKQNPVVNAGPDRTILIGESTTLSGSANGTPQSIAWTPAASIVSGATSFTPTVKPAVTTTYTMTVKDLNNCTSTDNALVTIIPYCVKPMDAFSPNNDGINDRWNVSAGTSCTNQIFVKVYNRYGSLIYRNDNYNNNWDGTYSGKDVADGTYYYVITYNLINGKAVQLTGNVTILR